MASIKAGRSVPSPNEYYVGQREQRVQTQLTQALAPAVGFPDLQGNEIAVTVTAGQTFDVAHKLGRAPLGWYVIRCVGTAPAALYELATQPAPTKFLRLKSDNAGTLTIRIF
jgi:hypothetical protein